MVLAESWQREVALLQPQLALVQKQLADKQQQVGLDIHCVPALLQSFLDMHVTRHPAPPIHWAITSLALQIVSQLVWFAPCKTAAGQCAMLGIGHGLLVPTALRSCLRRSDALLAQQSKSGLEACKS